jgi:hypothetical protein
MQQCVVLDLQFCKIFMNVQLAINWTIESTVFSQNKAPKHTNQIVRRLGALIAIQRLGTVVEIGIIISLRLRIFKI